MAETKRKYLEGRINFVEYRKRADELQKAIRKEEETAGERMG